MKNNKFKGLTRRHFLMTAGMGFLGAAQAKPPSTLCAQDVVDHFLKRAPWVNKNHTVDRVIIGNPKKPVSKCLVTWMPSFKALRQMVKMDLDFMVCHEPTFWNHLDKRPTDPDGLRKMEFIKKHDLVIVRNHDCWDRWPKIGIPSAWGDFLELGTPTKIHQSVQHRYDIEPVELDRFAARVATHCAKIGEKMVQVTGDPKTKVSKIGIGTGCICNIDVFRQMGCDCSIVTDDGGQYWSSIQRAADAGHPIIRVHHGVSEEPGMKTLTDYINANIQGLKAVLLPHGCTFRLVGI